MSKGPPFTPDDSDADWSGWREQTTPLDYQGRDIRIIFPEQRGGTLQNPKHQPPEFGDFDPNVDDPDPDVWPLEDLDPGYPADIDDLVLVQNPFPAPHVVWVTEEYLEAVYGYNPVRQEVDAQELPEWARPDGANGEDSVELSLTNGTRSIEVTETRQEALTRLGRLWNGEEVNGQHLLLDKLPDWMRLFGDLDQDELKRLVVDPQSSPALAEAFGEYDWYTENNQVYLKPTRILKKKVWYAPTQRGRMLIHRHPDLPDLIGDLNESLTHRVTVGLAAIREVSRDRKIGTYYDINDYTVDLVSQATNDQLYASEIITGHNNQDLHKSTYRKLEYLHKRDVIPHVIFDSRETAYNVFNLWHRHGLAELPRSEFESEFSIPHGRKTIQEAYENERCDWVIPDWSTTTTLWRDTLGSANPDTDRNTILSLNW